MPGDRFEGVGVLSELTPFGARWPDGSVRFARMSAYLSLAPGEDVQIPVQRAVAPPQTFFALGPAMTTRLPGFEFDLMVGRRGGQSSVSMSLHSIVDATDTRRTMLFRGRMPDTQLVYDMWITIFAGQDHARFELRVTNSDTRSRSWRDSYKWLKLRVKNAIPMVQHEDYYGIDKLPTHGDETVLVLMDRAFDLYDGQGYEWYGSLFFYDESLQVPDVTTRIGSAIASVRQTLYGVATNWAASGAFGPFGVVPDLPPWLEADNGMSANAAERAEFMDLVSTRRDIFADRNLGLQQHAGAVGDQHDFGTTQCGDIVRTTSPLRIDEVRFSVAEEALRPTHFREVDGSPITSAAHPDWVTWRGRTHFDPIISPDRLGKPHPEPNLSRRANGWTGKDNEHWSSLTLAVAYLLTTSDSVFYEINNECEVYLAGHTLPSQGLKSTNSIGAARGVGRTMLSMSWHYLCTGRQDLLDRLEARVVECVQPQYASDMTMGPVKPMVLGRPDGRLEVQFANWSPWGESIASVGMAACACVTGSTVARDLAERCATSVVQHGWRVTRDELQIGYSMAFLPDGQALSPEQYMDPATAEWARSAGLRLWCMPAVSIALSRALRGGDFATAERALLILDRITRARAPQRTGRWDRFANWQAVDVIE